MPGTRLYDREHETPANAGKVIDLWSTESDWEFETLGALALQPRALEVAEDPPRRLLASGTSVTVPRMAAQAPRLPARTRDRRREDARAKTRRARRIAALVLVAVVSLVTLVLTAFGTGAPTTVSFTGPAPANRLLPSGPPRPQVVAMQDTLRIQLPINQSRITAIGYHASGTGALALEPVGTQANAGLVDRLLHKLFGESGSDLHYYLLDGGVGPQTSGLDVGAPVETDVYAPVDGSVIAVTDQVLSGRAYGVRIDIQPSGNPGVFVSLENLRADPALKVGSTVRAGRTKIGRVLDLSNVERAGLARYTQDNGQHVHLEVHAATSIASP
jgi:murein DD-endopeptidase MepM/ murein hydrolase activator NlpD